MELICQLHLRMYYYYLVKKDTHELFWLLRTIFHIHEIQFYNFFREQKVNFTQILKKRIVHFEIQEGQK